MINKNGLTSDEVIKNRKKYGNNSLTKKNNDTFFKLLLETLSDPIIKILLIALGIKTIFLIKDFDWYETVGIVIAIMVASLISSISEYGSMRAFNKLTEETSLIKVRAKRDNKVIEIPINDVVYNDIILLGEGDKVPADGIIVSGSIAVDESMLDGEAKEKYKKACIDINKIEDDNKVYMSSVVYNGSALMLVTQVGDNTIYGKLAQELQEKEEPSPLKLRLTELAKNISRIGYVASFLVAFSFLFNKIFILNEFNISMILSTLTNYKIMFSYILEAMTLCVTIIVVAVPEGLPMMITLVLSSNMKTMLKNNVLVRKLMGIETAGNILFREFKEALLLNGNSLRDRCCQLSEKMVRMENGSTRHIRTSDILNPDFNAVMGTLGIPRPYAWYYANNKSENPGYAPRNCDQLALHILKFYVQKFQNENAWPDFMGWAGFITKEEMLKKMAEINAANIIKNDVDGIEYLKKAY